MHYFRISAVLFNEQINFISNAEWFTLYYHCAVEFHSALFEREMDS